MPNNVEQKDILNELQGMKMRMETLYSECFSEKKEDGAHSSDAAGEVDWVPAADAVETDDEWIAVVDLPGVEENGLHVNLTEGELVIEGVLEESLAGNDFRKLRTERSYGHFKRSFELPSTARLENVTAELKLGVLTVRVPKRRISPVRVEVQSE